MELLVVLAIVVVLATILLPVIGGVRREAARSANASQIRQIGTALNLYIVDNGGVGPLDYRAPNGSNTGISVWQRGKRLMVFGPLFPYAGIDVSPLPDGTPDLFISPLATDEQLAKPSFSGSGSVETTYMLNPDASYNRSAGDVRINTLPSERVVIADLCYWWNPQPNHNSEGKGLHVFRMNGSVEWISTEETMGFPGWNWSA